MIVSEYICLLIHYPTVTPYHHDYILICSDGFYCILLAWAPSTRASYEKGNHFLAIRY